MSFKTGTASYVYDIGNIEILKGISWTAEGVAKVRYRIADTRSELSTTQYVDTIIERFNGTSLSSEFQESKSDLTIVQPGTNVLEMLGAVSSVGKDIQFLPDSYGGEVETVDILDSDFTTSALMQLDLPLSSVGGKTYLGVRSTDGYQEILVQKRIVQSGPPTFNGYQQVFSGEEVDVDGYSHTLITQGSQARLTETLKQFNKSMGNMFVDETALRNEHDEFVSSYPIKKLLDAYGTNIGRDYDVATTDNDYIVTYDESTTQLDLFGNTVQAVNYSPINDEWIAADVNYRWSTQVYLERGTYLYRYLITRKNPDDTETSSEITDPRNLETQTNDFGQTYSLLEVETPGYVEFFLYAAVDKVSVVANFNDYVPDANKLEVGTEVEQIKRIFKDDDQLYTNNWSDWNRIDIELEEPTIIEKIHFETLVAESDRQKIQILLDDEPISRDEYRYVSGRDLSEFENLPIPKEAEVTTNITKIAISEFDLEFDDTADGYGYIDSSGQVNQSALYEALSVNDDGYGLTVEERYINWRHGLIPALSTDDEDAFNTIQTNIEQLKITSSDTQVILNEVPMSLNEIEAVRVDSFTEEVIDSDGYGVVVSSFNMSNRVATTSEDLNIGMYRFAYNAIIYGGTLINDVLQDGKGDRYQYISGNPTTGALVEVVDYFVLNKATDEVQLSAFPKPPYSNIVIDTLGDYPEAVDVGIVVSNSTLSLNSYLAKGTYVTFYTDADGYGFKRAEIQTFSAPFNSIDLIHTPDSAKDIDIYFSVSPADLKLNIISISGRTITFNSPTQDAIYKITYKSRDLNPTEGSAAWISIEDGYGEWIYNQDGYGTADGYGFGGGASYDAYGDAYGGTNVRSTVSKISLLSRLESLSGNPRQHKLLEVYSNEAQTQTHTDFTLRRDDFTFRNNEDPTLTEFITIAGSDETFEIPSILLPEQGSRLSVKSEHIDENGIVQEIDGLETVDVSLIEPYIEPFIDVDGYGVEQLQIEYGREKNFIANIFDIIEASDGYGTFEDDGYGITRTNDDIWYFKRQNANGIYVTDYALHKTKQRVEGWNESGFATGLFSFIYESPVESVSVPQSENITLPSDSSSFTVGDTIDLQIDIVNSKTRLTDLDELQVNFFYGEDNNVPDSLTAQINDYAAIKLLPNQQVDAYGDLIDVVETDGDGYGFGDGYGLYVTYSANASDFFFDNSIDSSEVIKTVVLEFDATSEKMILGIVSLKATSQISNSVCEVVVNNELKYKDTQLTNFVNLDAYNIVVSGRKYSIICKGEAVYDGELPYINPSRVILGTSPREYDQFIRGRFATFELKKYMTVPQNTDAAGRYIEVEVTIDDFGVDKSKLIDLDLVVQYTDPVFPKRPKLVGVF